MISKHLAHSTSLPVGFRTWLWRYTCLLLLISMLWHRQAIFESKGDKLSSFAKDRIRTQGLRYHIIYMAWHDMTHSASHTGVFWRCLNYPFLNVFTWKIYWKPFCGATGLSIFGTLDILHVLVTYATVHSVHVVALQGIMHWIQVWLFEKTLGIVDKHVWLYNRSF